MESSDTSKSSKLVSYHDGTFEEVLAEAQAQKKLVFVDFVTVWCAPCKWFEADVLETKPVSKFLNKEFVNFQIDAEKGEGPQLAFRYIVTQFPTLYFLDAEGNILESSEGTMTATAFMEMAERALANRPL